MKANRNLHLAFPGLGPMLQSANDSNTVELLAATNVLVAVLRTFLVFLLLDLRVKCTYLILR